MQRSGFIKKFFWGETPCSNSWDFLKTLPPRGKRVLVKSEGGEINIGHLDPDFDNLDLWLAYTIELAGKRYKFNIKSVIAWKEIPQ